VADIARRNALNSRAVASISATAETGAKTEDQWSPNGDEVCILIVHQIKPRRDDI
jgi:hypothetical protein